MQKGIYCQPSPVLEGLYDLPVQARRELAPSLLVLRPPGVLWCSWWFGWCSDESCSIWERIFVYPSATLSMRRWRACGLRAARCAPPPIRVHACGCHALFCGTLHSFFLFFACTREANVLVLQTRPCPIKSDVFRPPTLLPPINFHARAQQSMKRLKTLRDAHGDQLKEISIKDPEVILHARAAV